MSVSLDMPVCGSVPGVDEGTASAVVLVARARRIEDGIAKGEMMKQVVGRIIGIGGE